MAKASSLAENLVKELECAVCLDQYKEPKVLPCLHSFCKKCLQGLLAKQGLAWSINCPSCRMSVEIPKGEVDSLPVNFFLNNLLSMLSLHGDSGSSSLECDNCESGDPPVNRCTTCCHFLCEFCTQGHRRGRGTSSHHVLSLEEAKKMGSIVVQKPSFCKEHEGELLKLFCETCDEPICRDCTIVKHREHKYTFVKDAFSKGKESVLKILSETKTKVSVLKEALDGVSEMKSSIQSHAEQTMQEVLNCFQDLTACLNTRCEELVHDIEELKKSKLKSLEIQQGELETALGSVESSIEFTKRALENGSEVEILNMRKQMSHRLQELNSARWQLEPCAHDVFQFYADHQLQQALLNFGDVTDVRMLTHAGTSTVTMGHGSEGVMYNTLNGQSIEFSITAKECNGRKRKEGGDIFEVKICTQQGETVLNDSIKDCGNGTYSFCFTPNHGDMKYQLSVQLNGCHVRGSPFAWFNEVWNLCSEVHDHDICGANSGNIQLARDRMTATYCQTSYAYEEEFWVEEKEIYLGHVDFTGAQIVQPSGGKAFGSSSFGFGKHSWKTCISGNVFSFAFGVGVSPDTRCPWKFQWTWTAGNKHQPSSQPQPSAITDCINSDVIEFYLDCDDKTLMMYNQRTKQFDTWKGLQGNVRPMFEMCHVGDVVSLAFQVMDQRLVPYGNVFNVDDDGDDIPGQYFW